MFMSGPSHTIILRFVAFCFVVKRRSVGPGTQDYQSNVKHFADCAVSSNTHSHSLLFTDIKERVTPNAQIIVDQSLGLSLWMSSASVRGEGSDATLHIVYFPENFAQDKNPTNYQWSSRSSVRQWIIHHLSSNNHLLALIDINKTWENVAGIFVIKNTQNTNHYLISAGTKD